MLHGWLSLESKGGGQQNWRRQELNVQDVCVHWGARVIVPPPGSERASNPGTTRDTCTLRHCKYEKLGKKLCAVGKPGSRPGAEVRTYRCFHDRRVMEFWQDANDIQSDNRKFRSRLLVGKNCTTLYGDGCLMLVW